MAITKPVLFTPIEDAEMSYIRPNAEEGIRKMIQNLNLIAELAPIGSIRAVALNQGEATAVDNVIWQRADGEEITEPTSPLKSEGMDMRVTPDMRNRYIKGADGTINLGNELGGSATTNLAHTHTIGPYSPGNSCEEGNETNVPVNDHTHPVTSNLNSAEPLEMAHQQVDFYLKIN